MIEINSFDPSGYTVLFHFGDITFDLMESTTDSSISENSFRLLAYMNSGFNLSAIMKRDLNVDPVGQND